MKDQLQLTSPEAAMSAAILSAFYDVDMLYKVMCVELALKKKFVAFLQ